MSPSIYLGCPPMVRTVEGMDLVEVRLYHQMAKFTQLQDFTRISPDPGIFILLPYSGLQWVDFGEFGVHESFFWLPKALPRYQLSRTNYCIRTVGSNTAYWGMTRRGHNAIGSIKIKYVHLYVLKKNIKNNRPIAKFRNEVTTCAYFISLFLLNTLL